MKKFKWINIKKQLPKIIHRGRDVNWVLIRWKAPNTPDCGFEYDVSNTEFIHLHPEYISHWMYIPAVK